VYELKNAKTMDQHGKSKVLGFSCNISVDRGRTLIGQKRSAVAFYGLSGDIMVIQGQFVQKVHFIVLSICSLKYTIL
jgi:hypothetical protein